jgi:hypothetical protein
MKWRAFFSFADSAPEKVQAEMRSAERGRSRFLPQDAGSRYHFALGSTGPQQRRAD